MRPEFFVIVAAGTAADSDRLTVLPPPEPPPIDTTDWGFFFLGWVFQLSWVVGCFRPLCRKPRFPQRQNFQGWLGNVIGEIAWVPCLLLLHSTELCVA